MHIFHITKSKYISEVVSFQFFGGKKLIVTRGQKQWVKYLTLKPACKPRFQDMPRLFSQNPLPWFDVWQWACFKEVKAFHISVINKSISRRSRPRKCSFRMIFSKGASQGNISSVWKKHGRLFPTQAHSKTGLGNIKDRKRHTLTILHSLPC